MLLQKIKKNTRRSTLKDFRPGGTGSGQTSFLRGTCDVVFLLFITPTGGGGEVILICVCCCQKRKLGGRTRKSSHVECITRQPFSNWFFVAKTHWEFVCFAPFPPGRLMCTRIFLFFGRECIACVVRTRISSVM